MGTRRIYGGARRSVAEQFTVACSEGPTANPQRAHSELTANRGHSTRTGTLCGAISLILNIPMLDRVRTSESLRRKLHFLLFLALPPFRLPFHSPPLSISRTSPLGRSASAVHCSIWRCINAALSARFTSRQLDGCVRSLRLSLFALELCAV